MILIILSVLLFSIGLSMVVYAPYANTGYKDAEAGHTYGWSAVLIMSGFVLACVGLWSLVYILNN